MIGRPRTVSDAEILKAVAVAVGKVGPAKLTLAHVAAEAGISPGALVQRYGSKRALLQALTEGSLAGFVGGMRAAFDSTSDPVEGIIRAVVGSAGGEASPEEFANHLAFLHFEMADPEFRALLAELDAAILDELRLFLKTAAELGYIHGDTSALAHAINAIRNGTQIAWAVMRNGTLEEAMRRDLETLLKPYIRHS